MSGWFWVDGDCWERLLFENLCGCCRLVLGCFFWLWYVVDCWFVFCWGIVFCWLGSMRYFVLMLWLVVCVCVWIGLGCFCWMWWWSWLGVMFWGVIWLCCYCVSWWLVWWVVCVGCVFCSCMLFVVELCFCCCLWCCIGNIVLLWLF